MISIGKKIIKRPDKEKRIAENSPFLNSVAWRSRWGSVDGPAWAGGQREWAGWGGVGRRVRAEMEKSN